jgi:glucose-1-phosphate adenylyltransferase
MLIKLFNNRILFMNKKNIQPSHPTPSIASIVLAGGQGTRLQPLTSIRCKPAVSFGGRFRLIDIPISNSLNAQINKIFVISQYLSGSLKNHIDDTYSEQRIKKGNLEILSPQDPNQPSTLFKGTADAVRKNWFHLAQTPTDYFLILSGDQLYNIDFVKMVEFAKKTQADLVIASLPIQETEAKRMGLLKIDRTGKILDFVEKPSDPVVLKNFVLSKEKMGSSQTEPAYLGSMGIYIFKKEALGKLLAESGDDFGHDLIPLQVKTGSAFAYIYDGYWEDIGTIDAFYHANLALIDEGKAHLDITDTKHPIQSQTNQLPDPVVHGTRIHDSLIGKGSIINAKEITHSVIGLSSCIHEGTVVEDSVILGNHFYPASLSKQTPLTTYFSIGENCIIKKAIIDENTYIGNHVRLINQNNLSQYDGDGVYIRDGIIVVPSGAVIPDGFTL